MSLCLSVTLSAIESEKEIAETVYIENGAASVELSCGDVPPSAVAIDWCIYNSNEWIKLLKFYHTQSVNLNNPRYSNDSYYKKYDTSKSVGTSLVVKDIKLSDSALFKCGSAGGSNHNHMTMLQVVGK